jgi:hypothetical protein
MNRQLSWWRLLLGLLLVYMNGKFLLFPQTRTLQPSNAGEATEMLLTDVVLIVIGQPSFTISNHARNRVRGRLVRPRRD